MCVCVYVCVCVYAYVCVSTFSNISSETTGLIEAKFHEPPLDRGMKVYSMRPGHMTKMAAMPIYGKNLKKSFSLICSIRCSSTTKFIQMVTLG